MKFKYKVLIGFAVTTVFVFSVQCAMQFIQTYKFVGFEKKDQSTWVGIAETAQADNLSCQQQVEELKKARDEANSDIMQPLGQNNE